METKAKNLIERLSPDADKLPALLAGVGLALVLVQVIGYIDALIGYLFILASVVVGIATGKKFTLGPRWVVIPLGIIIGVIVARVAVYPGEQAVYELGFMGLMIASYISARICGRDIFWTIGPVVVILSLATITYAGINWSTWYDNENELYNYNLVVAVLIFGTILCSWKRKWLLATLALPSVFLTGASAGLLALATVGVIMILQRDWSRKVLVPLAITGILIVGAVSTGFAQLAYERTGHIVAGAVAGDEDANSMADRIDTYKLAVSEFTLLGHGYLPQLYSVPADDLRSIHNTPLRVFYELGPLAMGAWLFVMLFGIIKTRWKYAFGVILALGMFDHMMWTWLAPLTFIILGVSTMDDKRDYLFRKETIDAS